MERITDFHYAEAIRYSLNLLPCWLKKRLQSVQFFTGTDPLFAGLHNYKDTKDSRSYRNTAHVCYPWNAINPKEQTTIVLPTPADAKPYVIIHEIGHCVDEVLGFQYDALPINDYAKSNRYEAFAESFAAQYFFLGKKADDIFLNDKNIQVLFRRLQRGETCK
jgi:hypothetical protein